MTQRFFINTVAHAGRKRGLAQQAAGGHTLRGGVQRGQQHKAARHAMGQTRQCRHALRADVGIGRHPVVGQAIPAGKHHNRQIRRKKPQRVLHGSEAFVVARHMRHGGTLVQFAQDQLRVIAFGGTADCDMGLAGHQVALIGPYRGRVNCAASIRTTQSPIAEK